MVQRLRAVHLIYTKA